MATIMPCPNAHSRLAHLAQHVRGSSTAPRGLSSAQLPNGDAEMIPTVDLTQPEADVLAQIRRAADSGGPGFFYLANHGVDQKIFDDCIRAAHAFYAETSLAEKRGFMRPRPVDVSGGGKGYVPPGREGAYSKDVTDSRPKQEAESGQLNTREAFVFRYPNLQEQSKEGVAEPPRIQDQPYCTDYATFRTEFLAQNGVASGQPSKVDLADIADAARFFFLAPQPWPEQFKPVVQDYVAAMRKLAVRMYGFFEALLEQTLPHELGMCTFNIVHYPPEAVGKAAGFGISDHTDWELFTLLYPAYLQERHVADIEPSYSPSSRLNDTDNTNIDPVTKLAYTGLEVWYQDHWVAVPHKPGTVIVNQGEMLSRLSGGAFRAPVHRVAGGNPFERYSLVSFWAPDFDVALPGGRGEASAVPAGEHYLARNGLLRRAAEA